MLLYNKKYYGGSKLKNTGSAKMFNSIENKS